jgi:uncharacterized membrane protein
MTNSSTRKIVVTGILGAISIVLASTPFGFIPMGAISITIMQLPAIIGAILEGPVVGSGVGLIFGVASLVRAAVAPLSPADVIFTNPLISVLPRIFIGPAAWFVYKLLGKLEIPAIILAGFFGSLTNTVLVLGMIGVLGIYPWAVLYPIALTNGLPEAGIIAFASVVIVAAIKQINLRRKPGANLSD